MTSKEGENFSIPSAGSNPIIGSTSTTDGTLGSKRRKLTLVISNDFDQVKEDKKKIMLFLSIVKESSRPMAIIGQNIYMYT